MKYVKIREFVEAFQYDGDLKGSDGKYYVPDWAVKAFEEGELFYRSTKNNPPCDLFVKLKNSDRCFLVNVGEYIIKYNDETIGVMRKDYFESDYFEVKDYAKM